MNFETPAAFSRDQLFRPVSDDVHTGCQHAALLPYIQGQGQHQEVSVVHRVEPGFFPEGDGAEGFPPGPCMPRLLRF